MVKVFGALSGVFGVAAVVGGFISLVTDNDLTPAAIDAAVSAVFGLFAMTLYWYKTDQ